MCWLNWRFQYARLPWSDFDPQPVQLSFWVYIHYIQQQQPSQTIRSGGIVGLQCLLHGSEIASSICAHGASCVLFAGLVRVGTTCRGIRHTLPQQKCQKCTQQDHTKTSTNKSSAPFAGTVGRILQMMPEQRHPQHSESSP